MDGVQEVGLICLLKYMCIPYALYMGMKIVSSAVQ